MTKLPTEGKGIKDIVERIIIDAVQNVAVEAKTWDSQANDESVAFWTKKLTKLFEVSKDAKHPKYRKCGMCKGRGEMKSVGTPYLKVGCTICGGSGKVPWKYKNKGFTVQELIDLGRKVNGEQGDLYKVPVENFDNPKNHELIKNTAIEKLGFELKRVDVLETIRWCTEMEHKINEIIDLLNK